MRPSQLFFSLVSLALSFFLLFLGIFLLFVPHVTPIQEKFKFLVLNRIEILGQMGIALILFSLSLLVIYGLLTRRKYFLIRMGGKVSIHEKIIKEITLRSLSEIFPNAQINCDVIIRRKGRIEILADIPYIADKEDEVFEKIENTLNAALAKCGIEKEFLLNVHFN